ncbi:hypothetical protein [Alteromonas sp. a30]|uniref:hypothetical protein n=1 Tax=Alteromonas sp. a30 TaxID=2730917 RepID=UPI00227EEA6E|nr:hypothetical protein [Alteromonas sp. a30]MCY7296155.1 hypothetical protein [Alteromonas sp. a30]
MSTESRTVRIYNHGGFPIHELIVHHFQFTGNDPDDKNKRYNEQTVLYTAKNSEGNYLSAPSGVVVKHLDDIYVGGTLDFQQNVDPDHKSHWNVAWRCALDKGIYYLTQDDGFFRQFAENIADKIISGIGDAVDFFTESDLGTVLAHEAQASVNYFIENIDKSNPDTIEHKFHGDSSCRQDIHIGMTGDHPNTVNRDKAQFNSDSNTQSCTVHNFGFGS